MNTEKGMPSYREGQAIICDEVVKYLADFHGLKCRPMKAECVCWTETQQKHFQSKAKVLREYDASMRAEKRGKKS